MNNQIIEQKKNKPGRKLKYNKTLLREIFEDLAKGEAIRSALNKPGRPAWSTFREYINKDPELMSEYLKSRSDGVEYQLNDAEDLLNNTIDEAKAKGKGDLALTHLVKTSIDLVRWKAEKLNKSYQKNVGIGIKDGEREIVVKWES